MKHTVMAMRLGKTIRVIAASIATLTFVLIARAEEVRQPMPAPPISPTPTPCLETRFYKIVLNHMVDVNGVYRDSYYAFVVAYYIDGQHYYIVSPSYQWKTGTTLTHDPVARVWKLTWRQNGYDICVTAGFFEEITTPYDWWYKQKPYTDWFMETYPAYKIPKVATSPTPTPLVGI